MDDSAQEDVAAEVRAQLARARRSGSSLAQAIGWTQKYLSRRLTGQVPFDVNDLSAISRALGVPVTAFFPAPAVRKPGFWTHLRVAVAA